MGSSVEARCECGYEGKFLIGGGMGNFEEFCSFPCLCGACKQIVGANLLEPEPTCPDCESRSIVPYDQPELIGKEGSETVESWDVTDALGRELKLTNGSYYCPSCETFRLTFVQGGILWD
jgi:Zn finger protein HypA/HybF involved in hydrogenase expression